ncbi:MAG: hypothetical protein AB7U26_02830 [Sulfuricurvum sp.]
MFGRWLYRLLVKIKSGATIFCTEIDMQSGQRKWLKEKCTFVIVAIVMIGYLIFNHYAYGNIPIFKNDIRIVNIIKSKFPADYDVTIKKGDLVGLGENFYVAYGNKHYVKKLFAIGWSEVEKIEKYKNEVNYPIVKIFYVDDSGIFQYIHMPDFFLEFKVKELYTYKPIVLSSEDNIDIHSTNAIEIMKNEYQKSFSGTSLFYLSDLKILDIDDDGKDEIVATWISYAGGSGGTKFSTIMEFIDGKIKLSSGYPDFMDYRFSSIYYAIVKNTGMIPHSKYNPAKLKNKLKKFVFYIDKNIEEYHLFEQKNNFKEDLWRLSDLYYTEFPSSDAIFYNIANEKEIEKNAISFRHTDIYSNFLKYDNKVVFVEAFYLDDDECHWCQHEWMLLSFIYKDGRWLSDRNVNGNGLNAQFLNSEKKYTLHDIHGTYELPGNIMGLAWNFISPDWNPAALQNISDPQGIGMIKKSPVIEYMDKIYK